MAICLSPFYDCWLGPLISRVFLVIVDFISVREFHIHFIVDIFIVIRIFPVLSSCWYWLNWYVLWLELH